MRPRTDNPFTAANPTAAAAASTAAAAEERDYSGDESEEEDADAVPGEKPVNFACTCELTWHVSPVLYLHPLPVRMTDDYCGD